MRRIIAAAAVAVGALTLFLPARAAAPSGMTVSQASPSVRWTGGPLNGSAAAGCVPRACDTRSLTIAFPRANWVRHPGGIVVRIDWPNEDDEMDLLMYDAAGDEVGRSDQFRTNFEQIYLPAPPNGTYKLMIVTTDVINTTYTGSARAIETSTTQASSSPNSMRFAPVTRVDGQLLASEPSIWVDSRYVYVTAPSVDYSWAWRSGDGGRTFALTQSYLAPNVADPRHRPCTEQGGGGDTDIITDGTGRVYMADLENYGVSVAWSTDHGLTWQCTPLASTTPEDDRPWLAPAPGADGPGPNIDAYLAYRDFTVGAFRGGAQVKPISIHIDATRDGGMTWQRQGEYAVGAVERQGPIFTTADGSLYQVYDQHYGVYLARSTDEGKTFSVHLVSQRLGATNNVWIAGDVDRAGNVYVAWVDRGPNDVMYSYSQDNGVHWSVPRRVNAPTSGSTLMPWLAAGSAGDVAIAWYESAGRFPLPSDTPDATPWYPMVARSLSADTSNPRFQITSMSDTPIHFGKICRTTTNNCGDHVADFFEIAIATDGAVLGTFIDNGYRFRAPVGAGPTPEPYIVVARQASGLGMTATAVANAARAAPSTDDDPAVPQLAFTTAPSLTRSSSAMRVSFALASATNLAQAMSASNTGVSANAYWIALWKSEGRIAWVGMRVTTTGATSFFGGIDPKGVLRPDTEDGRYNAYPAQFTLNGSVDPRTGRVQIDAPLALYDLKPTQPLSSLQGFSFVGLGIDPTGLEQLRQIDTTPAVDVVVRAPTTRRPVVRGAHSKGRVTLPATGSSDAMLAAWGIALLACALALGLRERFRVR